MTARRLPALDGLRAIAVLVVIIGHANYPLRGVPADLGVNLFFVLSGLLITRLLLQEISTTGSVSLSQFYLRRTLRIFPAYYAFVALSFVLDRVMGDDWSTGLSLSAVTYTVNYFNATHGHPSTSIAHAWSLSVEEQFYLLWPVVLILLASYRRLVSGTIAIAAAAFAWRTVLVFAGADVAYVYNAFDTRLDCLAIGCLLAAGGSSPFLFRRVTRAWYPLLTIAALCASRWVPSATYHYSLGFTVEALLCATLLAQLMFIAGDTRWAWLDSKPLRFLGMISYPMYLYHALGAAVGRRVPIESPAVQFAAALVATIALACGSYYVIERPALKLRARFEKRPKVDPYRAVRQMQRRMPSAFR